MISAYGIELSCGAFFPGSIGEAGNRIELTISAEDAAKHMLELMDPEKTKRIKYYVSQLLAEYTDYAFSFMQKDTIGGKVNVWMEKKGA